MYICKATSIFMYICKATIRQTVISYALFNLSSCLLIRRVADFDSSEHWITMAVSLR